MKLHYSATSPYVRKVLIVAHERGLADRLELHNAAVSPVTENPAVAHDNPLVKVPTLVLEDGTTLYDSRVIAEYLDVVAGAKLFPAEGAARWQALKLQAAADGLLDAAILIRYELGVRPAEKQWDGWIDGQYRKIRQTLDALEAAAKDFTVPGGIGEIAVGAALGYLDFRFADEGWRNSRPALAAFYAKIAELPSFVATRPPAG